MVRAGDFESHGHLGDVVQLPLVQRLELLDLETDLLAHAADAFEQARDLAVVGKLLERFLEVGHQRLQLGLVAFLVLDALGELHLLLAQRVFLRSQVRDLHTGRHEQQAHVHADDEHVDQSEQQQPLRARQAPKLFEDPGYIHVGLLARQLVMSRLRMLLDRAIGRCGLAALVTLVLGVVGVFPQARHDLPGGNAEDLDLDALFFRLLDGVEVHVSEAVRLFEIAQELRDHLVAHCNAGQGDLVVLLVQAGQRQLVGRRLRELVEKEDRAAAVGLQALDDVELLLQVCLELLGLLGLGRDGLHLVDLGLQILDRRFGRRDPHHHRAMDEHHCDDQHNSAYGCVQKLAAHGLLALGGPDGEEVDADHLSPGLRSARPTTTAACGAMSLRKVGLKARSSIWMWRKGSTTSVGRPVCLEMARASPGVRAAPPDRYTRESAPSAEVERKKSRDRCTSVARPSPTLDRTRSISSGTTEALSRSSPPTFMASASSKEMFSARWISSVNCLPPAAISRVKALTPWRRTWMLTLLAPMLTRATDSWGKS